MSRFAILATFFAVIALPAQAQVPLDVVKGEILPGWREADGTHRAALKLTLAPGWKTYWRAPGEGGIPPSFDWSGSENIAGVEVHFPTPELFRIGGMAVIGYKTEVLFPLSFETITPDAPIRLFAEVSLGVCEEICVPVSLSLTASLLSTQAKDAEITAALADLPLSGPDFDCDVSPISDGLQLRVESAPPSGLDHLVVESGVADVWVSPADIAALNGAMSATVDLVPPEAAPFALDRSEVRVTYFAAGNVFETVGCN